MLKLTFIPNGALPTDGLLLCATTRSLTELNVEFNHQRVITGQQLYGALNSLALDMGNQRNLLALRVRRSLDFSAIAFADPEAAFLFALDQPQKFAGTGTLQIEVQGAVTGASSAAKRWMLNTAVKGIRNKFEDLGIAPAFDYQFDGGLITPNSPF